jgi:hypothetical protein
LLLSNIIREAAVRFSSLLTLFKYLVHCSINDLVILVPLSLNGEEVKEKLTMTDVKITV